MRTLAVLALVVALAAPAQAQSRHDQALADLKRQDDAGARRAAVRTLAETGVMTDLPAMAGALRDSDPEVRALTQDAMWEVWSRTGDAEVDALFTRGVQQLGRRELDEESRFWERVAAAVTRVMQTA